MKTRDAIADIEQSIEATYQAYDGLDGITPEQRRFMAIYCTLISYADEHAGTHLLNYMMDGGISAAGMALLTATMGKPQLRTVKAMFHGWQFGTNPARQEDMRILLRGIIPEQGIALTRPNGRVDTITRGAFTRGAQ